MSKYYVSATRKSGGKIVALKLHPVNADGSFREDNSTVVTHDGVAKAILGGDEVLTIVRKPAGGWREGAKVEVLLRTDQNGSTTDNLDNLPDC